METFSTFSWEWRTWCQSICSKLWSMSLGASPSQFTPPNHHIQVSSGSPGNFGPTSPARGSVHGSPLSKTAAVGHLNNMRRSWGHPGSHSLPSQEDTTHWQGHHTDGANCNYGEGSSRDILVVLLGICNHLVVYLIGGLREETLDSLQDFLLALHNMFLNWTPTCHIAQAWRLQMKRLKVVRYLILEIGTPIIGKLKQLQTLI